MARIVPVGAAAALALATSVALASPQIPNPTNPYPDEPIATDGTPLPQQGVRSPRRPDAFNAYFGDRRVSQPTRR